jgi:sugar phosphate isomerase/epimerase
VTTADAHLVCSSDLFASLTRVEALRLIARLGFRFVDLWACPPMCHHVDPLREKPAAVRAELEREGLSTSSLSIFLTTHEEKMAGIEFAAELGASSVIFEPGPSADWPAVMSDLYAEGDRLIGKPGDTLERFVATAEPYFHRAEELGITIALEVPHVATVVEKLADIERLLTLEDSPALGLTFAPPHLAIAEENLLDAVRRVGHRITTFYLWNVKPGYVGSRDRRNYGPSEQQLGSEGALDLFGASETLLEKGETRDYVIIARGTERNPDGAAIARMVRASLKQVPKPLLQQLRAPQ